MAKLLYDSKLNSALEEIISEAESHIIFICPFFKLHDRLKDRLKLKMKEPEVRLIIVFGKNEEEPSKSLNKEDFEFLKSFPHVTIAYEKRLHAKYFANEKSGLVTSINLHSFSLNNNIEVGVSFKTKSILKDLTNRALNPLTSMISDTEDIANESINFFDGVYKNAEIIFDRRPKYESKMFGLQKSYTESEVLVDISSDFFQRMRGNFGNQTSKPTFASNSGNEHRKNNYNYSNQSNYSSSTGYCIRTRETIELNPSKPLSRDAYYVWAEFSNPDYTERYCHGCGKNWNTSVRRPFCNDCD